jgi:hypothetical protein
MADNPDASVDPIRFGALLQLEALIRFIESDPAVPAHTVEELNKLVVALLDIQKGLHVAWLSPKPKAGQPPLDAETSHLHGYYAAIMDWLMISGHMREKEAAEFVVTHGNLRRLIASRANAAAPWRTVYNWRQRVIGPPDPSRADERAGFDYMLSRIESLVNQPGTDPLARVKKLLRDIEK